MSTNSGTVRTTRRRLQAVDTRGDAHDSSDSVPSLTAALPRLAAALDEAAENEGWGRPPALVRIMAWPSKPLTEGFDLGVRPLDSEMSVVEALCGFTAPTEWLAIGVVTEGNARHLDDPGFEQRRVRCVHLVDRSGASGSTLRLHGEAATVLSSLDDHDPGGRVDDVCRLALGLPTAAPEHSTVALWALMWLERVIEYRGCARADPRFAWRDVAALHPAVALLVGDDERWGAQAARNLTRLGELLAEVHSWSVLRAACAADDWPVEDVPAVVAEWLDDGAFSRWVLGGFPPIGQLADVVSDLLAPSVGRRVRAALREWQLQAAPPDRHGG